MKGICKTGLLLALGGALLGWTAPAFAQGPCPEVVERMEQAAGALDLARDNLGRCSVPEGRALMESAVRNFKEAQDQVRQRRCRFAARRLEAAVELAMRAARVCAEGDRHREQLGQMLHQTQDFLHDAHDSMARSDSKECQRLFRAAQVEQEKAVNHFRSDRFRIALPLTLRARELCERALRCLEGAGADEEGGTERALQRTDRLLGDAAEAVQQADAGETARGLLADAHQIQRQAWRHFHRRRNVGLALRLTRQSRTLAVRALAFMESDLSQQDLDQMLVSTRELLEKLDEAGAESGDRATSELLRRAHRLTDEAASAMGGGKKREAFSKLRAASALALDAASKLGVDGDR